MHHCNLRDRAEKINTAQGTDHLVGCNRLERFFKHATTDGKQARLGYVDGQGAEKGALLDASTRISGHYVIVPDPYDPGQRAIPLGNVRSVTIDKKAALTAG